MLDTQIKPHAQIQDIPKPPDYEKLASTYETTLITFVLIGLTIILTFLIVLGVGASIFSEHRTCSEITIGEE